MYFKYLEAHDPKSLIFFQTFLASSSYRPRRRIFLRDGGTLKSKCSHTSYDDPKQMTALIFLNLKNEVRFAGSCVFM